MPHYRAVGDVPRKRHTHHLDVGVGEQHSASRHEVGPGHRVQRAGAEVPRGERDVGGGLGGCELGRFDGEQRGR